MTRVILDNRHMIINPGDKPLRKYDVGKEWEWVNTYIVGNGEVLFFFERKMERKTK